MAFTFAIADLHGRFDLLTRAFAEIEAYDPHPHKIVTMGDYVDRGPESRQIIEYLMRCNSNVICLKGNHEAMMVETLTKPLHPNWWVGNGGGATLISYGHASSGVYDPSVVPAEHLKWLDSLPLTHDDGKRIFVHAGVIPGKPIEDHSEDTLLWMLYPDGADEDYFGRHIVHGHHQFAHGPIKLRGRTDLDTLAWYTGRLVIGVFDDTIAGGAIDFIEIVLSPAEPATPITQEGSK